METEVLKRDVIVRTYPTKGKVLEIAFDNLWNFEKKLEAFFDRIDLDKVDTLPTHLKEKFVSFIEGEVVAEWYHTLLTMLDATDPDSSSDDSKFPSFTLVNRTGYYLKELDEIEKALS
ncbi:hypothetical protein [Shimazuella alba]|uniref:Uncharacterized protein n=1 Tax=Shimazuella alba TaxID=2690964 RepID=A0A6I4VX25_9BACL|nr:hypothetical protein [Shimazuella alba]MXQ55403.1 hypothetical protein [Shimazuella alba]